MPQLVHIFSGRLENFPASIIVTQQNQFSFFFKNLFIRLAKRTEKVSYHKFL